jgi:geranylgeranylglycerol-phosphate geranylgeranyltransferase
MHAQRYRTLFAAGSAYVDWLRRGRRPLLMVPVGAFFSELGWAVRPHFFALPMLAAAAGVARDPVISVRSAIAVGIAGIGWGVGQLLNDLLDCETDAIMAKDRAIVSGRLPAGPALAVAAAGGVVLMCATLAIHPDGWALAGAAALLLVIYNAAKRRPLAGNAAHGALMAVAAAIGNAAVVPVGTRGWGLVSALARSWPTFVMVASVAAFYLQSNYEKDRAGDSVAGYRTLAVVAGVRASAIVRAAGIVAIALGACALGFLSDYVSRAAMSMALVLGVFSTLGPIVRGTDVAALGAYRPAVHASVLAIMALGSAALGVWGTVAAGLLSAWFTERAFARTVNP